MIARTATAIATASVVAVLSFSPSVKSMLHTPGRLHLWWHHVTFLLAGVLILQAANGGRRQASLAIACIAFGGCLEVLEYSVYRTNRVETADILADAAGVMIGWAVLRLYRHLNSGELTGLFR